VLNADVHLDQLIINAETLGDGTYTSETHPGWFEGPGSFIVGTDVGVNDFHNSNKVSVTDDVIHFGCVASNVSVFSITGTQVLSVADVEHINLNPFKNGVYIISYQTGVQKEVLKHIVNHN
jgi:hypothetical protein